MITVNEEGKRYIWLLVLYPGLKMFVFLYIRGWRLDPRKPLDNNPSEICGEKNPSQMPKQHFNVYPFEHFFTNFFSSSIDSRNFFAFFLSFAARLM